MQESGGEWGGAEWQDRKVGDVLAKKNLGATTRPKGAVVRTAQLKTRHDYAEDRESWRPERSVNLFGYTPTPAAHCSASRLARGLSLPVQSGWRGGLRGDCRG